jgi:peptidoglycan hydrolase-like protein with peptidoglycan-binding domain
MDRSKRTVGIALGVAVVLAAVAWIAGGQIRSPAQVAAETAAPDPSAITVPVERRVLSSEVIVRGTVRYGSPQPVVLATSNIKQNAGGTGTDIVTTRPRRGSRFAEGTDVMSVSGRPVFVLRGSMAAHRDMGPGSRGPDVRQLEAALVRMGFSPGQVDGRYDGATASAVAAWYERGGWEPFGPTDTQLDQLRAARAAAAAARDGYLRSRVDIKTASERATKAEIEQARVDLQTARDTHNTAQHDLRSLGNAVSLALLNERRDNAVAAADVATKRAAVNKAIDARAEAYRNLAEAPPDTSPSERAALQAAVRATTDDVTVAQAELNSSIRSERAVQGAGRDGVDKARVDISRARGALAGARRQVTLATRRLKILTTPGDTTLQRLVSQAASREARGTAADVRRLAGKMGVYVPADEVLFFPTLPLRVDSVRARRGDSVAGRVMTVSNSRLAIDSSLSVNDAKLVRPGATVKIEEPDLGVQTTGVVSQVATAPGTHKVDPGRFYLQITPGSAPAQLVGASVKLTIAVKSTREAVMVVPVTALSVGADGNARVQVQRPGGKTDYVPVEPGLAAKGLVEVKAVGRARLEEGDLVIAGDRGLVKASTAADGLASGVPESPPRGNTTSTPGGGSTGATGAGANAPAGDKPSGGEKNPASGSGGTSP